MEIKLKDFNKYLQYKRYFVALIIITLIATFALFSADNYNSPLNEIVILIISLMIGIISFTYYINTKKLYKTALIIILLFGLMFVFLSPMGSIAHEKSEFVHSEITSQGVLFPGYIDSQNNASGYLTIASAASLPKEKTIFNTDWGNESINYTKVSYNLDFKDNIFYSYVAQAIGIELAKILNLNNIFMLWFARICNLLLYAALSCIAIRKTPCLKMPMVVMACFPASIVLASTCSGYAFVYSFTLVVIAYLLNLYKSKDFSITKKEILIYTLLVLILALAQPVFVSLILLLLIIPHNKFKNNKYHSIIPSIILTLIVLLLWAKFSSYISFSQLKFVITDYSSLISIIKIPNQIAMQINLFSVIDNHPLMLFNYSYLIFIVLFILFYPIKGQLTRNKKIFIAVILIITIIGLHVISLSKGIINLETGIDIIYYFPILVLLPLIFNINDKKIRNIDLITIMSVIIFLIFNLVFVGVLFY